MLILFCKAGKSEKKIYRILRYNFFITKNWKKSKGYSLWCKNFTFSYRVNYHNWRFPSRKKKNKDFHDNRQKSSYFAKKNDFFFHFCKHLLPPQKYKHFDDNPKNDVGPSYIERVLKIKKWIEFYGIIFLKLEYKKHKKMKNHLLSPFFKGELGDKRLV